MSTPPADPRSCFGPLALGVGLMAIGTFLLVGCHDPDDATPTEPTPSATEATETPSPTPTPEPDGDGPRVHLDDLAFEGEILEGQELIFTGTVTDPDSVLLDMVLNLHSDLDGLVEAEARFDDLETGAVSMVTNALKGGHHTVTLFAHDPEGQTGKDSIPVRVFGPFEPLPYTLSGGEVLGDGSYDTTPFKRLGTGANLELLRIPAESDPVAPCLSLMEDVSYDEVPAVSCPAIPGDGDALRVVGYARYAGPVWISPIFVHFADQVLLLHDAVEGEVGPGTGMCPELPTREAWEGMHEEPRAADCAYFDFTLSLAGFPIFPGRDGVQRAE